MRPAGIQEQRNEEGKEKNCTYDVQAQSTFCYLQMGRKARHRQNAVTQRMESKDQRASLRQSGVASPYPQDLVGKGGKHRSRRECHGGHNLGALAVECVKTVM